MAEQAILQSEEGEKMKPVLVMAMAFGLLFATAAAMAADTATLTVEAVVRETCLFNTSAVTLVLPELDPAASVPVSGSAALEFWCSNGTTFSLSASSLNSGDFAGPTGNAADLRSTTLPSPEIIAYTLDYSTTASVGGGITSPITLNVDVDIAGGAYSDRTPDLYRDVVTFTISP